MTTEERVMTYWEDANPIRNTDVSDLAGVDGATYLATLEQRSSEVTQLDTKRKDQTKRKSALPWLVAAAVAIIAGIGFIIVNQDDETPVADSPEAILSDYEEARSSGDVDAIMALYAEDAVVENHPANRGVIHTGAARIRIVENAAVGFQGPTGRIEFGDLVVTGNTVTFQYAFYDSDGGCNSRAGNEVTVEDGLITLFVWGGDERSRDEGSMCG